MTEQTKDAPRGSGVRSVLTVSSADPSALAEALKSGADCLLFDFRSIRDPAAAREVGCNFLAQARKSAPRARLFIRADISADELDIDLDAWCAADCDGVAVAAESGAVVQRLGVKLAVREAEYGRPDGSLKILAFAGCSGAAMFKLSSLVEAGRRLAAIAWDPRLIASDLGLDLEASGPAVASLTVGRSLVLYAAAAAKVDAFDAFSPEAGEGGAFLAECLRGRREGFAGKIAGDASQVAAINEAFAG